MAAVEVCVLSLTASYTAAVGVSVVMWMCFEYYADSVRLKAVPIDE